MLEPHKVSLPFGAKRIALFENPGSAASVRVDYCEQRQGDIPEHLFNVQLHDAQGRCLVELHGLSLIESDELAEDDRFSLSRATDLPGAGIVEQTVDIDRLRRALERDNDRKLPFYLHPEEIETFHEFKNPTRAWGWLGGRIAVKNALRRVMRITTGQHLRMNDIIINNDDSGKPLSPFPDVHISISHKEKKAIAAAVGPKETDGIGIDLEVIEAREKEMWEQFFTPAEQALALDRARADNTEESTYFTHLWAIKEAVLKSLGIGLRVDTRQVEVVALSPEGRAEVVLHRGVQKDHADFNPADSVTAWVDQKEDYVIARSRRIKGNGANEVRP